MTIYILTYLKFPFDTDKGVLELYKIIKEANVKFPLEPWYTRKIKFLIKECLEKDPNKRKSAEEILKVLMVHKKESLDKYKPIFKDKKTRLKSVNEPSISLQDLVYSLDFITNLKSAVFENPKNKNEKIVLKNDKKLNVYNVPKERKKITEIKNGEDDNKEEVIEKQIFVNNNLIETEEIIEGKNALKKYIEQK